MSKTTSKSAKTKALKNDFGGNSKKKPSKEEPQMVHLCNTKFGMKNSIKKFKK